MDTPGDRLVGSHRFNNRASHLALALSLFAVGLSTALLIIPEWRVNHLAEQAFYKAIFQKMAPELGYTLTPEEPRYDLISFTGDLPSLYRNMRSGARSWLIEEGRAVVVGVSQSSLDKAQRKGRLIILMSTKGEPWYIEWSATEATVPVGVGAPTDYSNVFDALIRPGEVDFKPEANGTFGGTAYKVGGVAGSNPPQFIYAESAGGVNVNSFRNVNGDDKPYVPGSDRLTYLILRKLPEISVLFLSIATLGWIIIARHFVFWKVGLVFSFFTLTSSLLVMGSGTILSFLHLVPLVMSITYRCSLILFVWVAAESLIVGSSHGAVTGLPPLIDWSFTPRGGSQVLTGIAIGLASAGIHLLEGSLTAVTPGLFPQDLSVFLQDPNFSQNPLYIALMLAALIALSEALARYVVSSKNLARYFKGSFFVALILATLLLSNYSSWGPWPFGLICALPIAGLFLVSLYKTGTVGLIVAALTYTFLPLTVFSGLHLKWLPLTFFATIIPQIAIGGVALLALSKRNQRYETLRIFISYSHRDSQSLNTFKHQLRDIPGVEWWCDQEIPYGYDFHQEINKTLRNSDIFIALVSCSLAVSRYCNSIEMRFAVQRNRRDQMRFVPVIIDSNPDLLSFGPLKQIQVIQVSDGYLPKALERWDPSDWNHIRSCLERTVQELILTREAR